MKLANSPFHDKRTVDKRGPALRAAGLSGDDLSRRHQHQEAT
jgi:hypothetical protein